MQKLSRRKIAQYVVDQYMSGATLKALLSEVAAYLIDTKRTREAELIVRAVEDELETRGTVVASVVSARDLTAAMRREITTMIDAKNVELRETVDPSVLGGVRIETPSGLLDATTKRKITLLKDAKV